MERSAETAGDAAGGAEAAEELDWAASPAPTQAVAEGEARTEPQMLVPSELQPYPAESVRAQVATLTLPRGAQFRPPTGACQDVLVLVREGELRARGSGIAPPSTPATLYPGDAVRFGAEADGVLTNESDQPARSVVAFVRAEGTGEPSLTDPGPQACEAALPEDPLRPEIRTASVRTSTPHSRLGGKLRVTVLLDEVGAGARHGGMNLLEADADVAVPDHRYPEAAQVLFVEQGYGVLRLGERRVRLSPGAALYVPAGTLHSWAGDGGSALRIVQVFTPSIDDVP